MSIRLIIADQHRVVLCGLKAILGRLPSIEIIAACCDGAEALDNIRTLKPDIAVLEVDMPLMGGLDVLAAVNSEKLTTRIVLISDYFDDLILRSAFTGGAFGLVQKDSSGDEYVACLMQVSRGLNWMSSKLQGRMVASAKKSRAGGAVVIPFLRNLTMREREVANMVRLGMSNRQIAQKLNVTEGTIKIHLHNIFRKTGVPNRTTLTAKIGLNGQ